jgi:hypothetical protein
MTIFRPRLIGVISFIHAGSSTGATTMFRDLNTILGLGILMFLCVATLYVVARSS